MRIWSIHPKYLDVKGLVALWREGLLAQNVLLGNTKGYKNHPQLERFKNQKNPTQAMANYLHLICDEADNRGYNFTRSKICHSFSNSQDKIYVTSGQIKHEWQHFLNKIKTRDATRFKISSTIEEPEAHKLFIITEGPVEAWEVV